MPAISEPPVKRRKVEGKVSSVTPAEDGADALEQTQTHKDSELAPTPALQARPSFADALTQMKKDAKETKDTQGGAKLWSRPKVPVIQQTKDSIILQQVEIQDSYADPVLKVFGVIEDGNSVLVHVTGFYPYLYVLAPREFELEDANAFKAYLNLAGQPVHEITVVQKHDIMGYKGDEEQTFFKFEATSQSKLSMIHDNGGKCRFNDLFGTGAVETYEAEVPYVLRFMVDAKITGMGWVELPAKSYVIMHEKTSYCQLEVSVPWNKFVPHPHDDHVKAAPLRILSFDIETAVRIFPGGRDAFPHPDHDQVYQISNMVTTPGNTDPFIRNVFTVGKCTPIDGVQILSFDTEAQMLFAWRDFVREVDPEIITGFNISFFDLPHIFGRAKKCKLGDFGDLGRLKGVPSIQPKTEWFDDPSMPKGRRSITETTITGRIVLDTWQYIRREFKFDMSKREYQLQSLSGRFLDDGKEGINFKEITPLFNGSPDDRAKLAVYCLKDSHLSLQLVQRLSVFECCAEMARVTGVPLSWILSHGPPMKVLSLLLSQARQQNYVIPTLKKPIETVEERYRNPHFGFHHAPQGDSHYWKWTADHRHAMAMFSEKNLSDRATAIVTHNICYCTYVENAVADKLGLVEDQDYVQTPNKVHCVKTAVREGILPRIILDLTQASERRGDARGHLEPLGKKIRYAMQLSWKSLADAIYDFAASEKLPCPALVTSRSGSSAQKFKGFRT